ncbi:MAG: xanthine dehydrogenase family protein subunit M [Acidimicrobiia bacterium]|nr:xanthine dehydrogenase family protein subunit M [Acidimicrobiia bacterium]
MKPAPFDYLAPESIADAVAALSEYGGQAKILAGGQSLIPMLAFRIARPAALIDLGRVPGLTGIRFEGDSIAIGAMTTHRSVELNEELNGRCPMVADALAVLGHVAIRNVGTVGGSLAHADPAAEWPALALALDASMAVAGPHGERSVPIADFLTGWMTTALLPEEVLVGVEFLLPPAGTGSAFLEVARRHGDFALAGAAVALGIEDGLVSHVRIALLGVGMTAVRANEAEDLLAGREPTLEAFDTAADAIGPSIQPLDDQQGTADYKRHLSRVLTIRALRIAQQRATDGANG